MNSLKEQNAKLTELVNMAYGVNLSAEFAQEKQTSTPKAKFAKKQNVNLRNSYLGAEKLKAIRKSLKK